VIEKLPTVADLRSRRLELTRAALRESLLKDDLDAYRAVVEPLSEEFDLFEVALAAVKLAHEASGSPYEEEELPEVELAPADGRQDRHKAAGRKQRGGRPAAGGTTRLFVGTGRSSGVGPADLVGVITGKSYLSGRDIGAIEIADRFSLVEIPSQPLTTWSLRSGRSASRAARRTFAVNAIVHSSPRPRDLAAYASFKCGAIAAQPGRDAGTGSWKGAYRSW